MAKRPEIAHTKRSSYRPMNHMNGDFLSQLKKPLCSEFGPEIRGTMRGRNAHCKHKVKLWFKDKEYNMRKITRSEDSVYDSFLQIHKEKRRLVRDAYKRQQQQAREAAQLARERGLDNVDKLVLGSTEVEVETKTGEINTLVGHNTTISDHLSSVQNVINENDKARESENIASSYEPEPPSVISVEDSVDNSDMMAPTGNLVTTTGEPPKHKPQKTKVLQVSKSNPQNPIVGERKCSENTDEEQNSQEIEGVEAQVLNKETDKKTKKKRPKQRSRRSGLDSVEIVNDAQQEEKLKALQAKQIAGDEEFHKINIKPKRSTYTNVMPAIDEIDQNSEITMAYQKAWQSEPVSPELLTSRSMEPFMCYGNNHKHSPPNLNSPKPKYISKSLSEFEEVTSSNMTSDTASNDSQAISLVILNKKRSKERDRLRKRILNSEPLIVYMKDPSGDIVPSITGFKRKTFDAPSNKEKYFQKKMLESQRQAQESQDDKIEKFFQKLDIEKDKENEYFRYRQARPPSVQEKLHPDLPSLGVGLEQMAAVFGKRNEPLPEQMDPASIEAMQFCQYLRSYDLDQPKKGKRAVKSPHVF